MRLFSLHEQPPCAMSHARYDEGEEGCIQLELHICVGISDANRERYARNVTNTQGVLHGWIDEPKEWSTKERHGYEKNGNDTEQKFQIVRCEDDMENKKKNISRRKHKDCFHLSHLPKGSKESTLISSVTKVESCDCCLFA